MSDPKPRQVKPHTPGAFYPDHVPPSSLNLQDFIDHIEGADSDWMTCDPHSKNVAWLKRAIQDVWLTYVIPARRDANPAPPASPPSETPSDEAACWLIEGAGQQYWGGRGLDSLAFVKDVNEAVRFVRQEDAERVRCWLLTKPVCDMSLAVQHLWISPRNQ